MIYALMPSDDEKQLPHLEYANLKESLPHVMNWNGDEVTPSLGRSLA